MHIFRNIGIQKSPGLLMKPTTYTITLIMSTRIQRKTKEAVGKENIFLKLLRPLLWYLSKAVIMLKQDKAITPRMYIWKVRPILGEFSLVTSHWNRKSRITWTISSPKFSNTISKKNSKLLQTSYVPP